MSRRDAGTDLARKRWYKTETALTKLRRDLQVYGVNMTWRQQPAKGAEPAKLLATLRGAVNNAARRGQDRDGNQTVVASQHSGYQDAAFAMHLIQPFFDTALIEPGGGVMPDGRWSVTIWLDASRLDFQRREAAVRRDDS